MLKLLRRLLKARETRTTGPDPARRSATADVLAKSRPRPGAGAGPAQPSAPQEFDPYNTGVFDRSASWERVGRR